MRHSEGTPRRLWAREREEKEARRHEELNCILHDSVDIWHGCKHRNTCPRSPRHIRRLKKRLQGVNTSCSERVFSWFRNYARTLDKMEPTVLYFLVLLFTKTHNEHVRKNMAGYLNAHSARKETRASATVYKCTRKRPAAAMS